MSRHPRFYEPDVAQLISTSTVLNQDLMASNKAVGDLIGGVLARYVNRHNIKLHSFVFLPNEFRLIASAPQDRPCDLSYFMRDLKAGITQKLKLLTGYSGIFFAARYKAVPILDNAALIEQVEAMHAFAASRSTSENYIFSSLDEYGGKKRSFLWEDRNDYYQRGGSRRWVETRYTEYALEVHVLSAVKLDTKPDRQEALAPVPASADCYVKDEHIKAAFFEKRTHFREEYREGAKALLAGDVFNAVFPKNCFKPQVGAQWKVRVFLDMIGQVA